MRNSFARVVRFSALVATGSALSFAVFFSNCGGEGGLRTGTAGSTGSAGTMGSAGSTGSAGTTGSGGRFVCPADSVLDCPAALTLMNGHVTNFSPEEWNMMDGKYCNASGLRGSVYSYSGPTVDGGNVSSNAHGVMAADGNFRLTLMAGPAGYAGGGISMDRCVNATASTGIRFTASLTTGDQLNCTFKIQVQTFEQRPNNQSPPGSCDPAGSCYGFPSSPNIPLTTTPTTYMFTFAELTTSATHANPIPGQVVGLQWQLESGASVEDGGPQTACSIEVLIDNIDFY
jgi:hypothetical protein